METDQVGRLRDILEAARLIGTYVKDTTETDFHANPSFPTGKVIDLKSE